MNSFVPLTSRFSYTRCSSGVVLDTLLALNEIQNLRWTSDESFCLHSSCGRGFLVSCGDVEENPGPGRSVINFYVNCSQIIVIILVKETKTMVI